MVITDRTESGTQPAVKMDKALFLDLTKWIKTDQAKGLGFHSKSHLVTQAVRDLMLKYRTQKYSDITKIACGYSMKDMFAGEIVKVIINKPDFTLECQTCYSGKEYKCDHVFTIWQIEEYVKELKSFKVQNPFPVDFSPAPYILNKK